MLTPGDPVLVRVPAKINLGLAVGRLGDDGYHPLATLFHAVSLYDEVRAEAIEPGHIELTMSGPGTLDLACDETNLAWRAAALLLDRHPGIRSGVRLSVRKRIPIAGGMAGGSADAAGALLACSVLWDLDLDPDDLVVLAAELGSDVPFALVGGNAVGTGRGERLVPALSRGQFHWVLALADGGLSTPTVFRRYDELGLGAERPELSPLLLQAIATGDARRLGATLHNDLERPALELRPDLARVLDAGRELGALGGVVSGSGPTIALLAADERRALDLAAALSSEGVCRGIVCASGPVPGARVVA